MAEAVETARERERGERLVRQRIALDHDG